ncbi:MAG: KEOPS complex subunit Pcc1 [Sulfolobaceae archaeon]
MKAKIKINIKYKNPEILYQSLLPDNIQIPKGLNIDMKYDNENLNIILEMIIKDPKDILTLRNTADEILTHVNSIIEVLDNLK